MEARMAASSSSPSAASPLLPKHQPVASTGKNDDDGENASSRMEAGEQQSPASPVRNLNLANGIALVLGLQIGSGIFVSPSLVAREAGSPALALGIWAAAGVITWACAVCYIELGTRLPYNGGVQEYLKFCFGERAAFVASWAIVFTVTPCSAAVSALLIATYVADACALEGVVQGVVTKVVAIAIMLLVTAVNCVGNKLTFVVTHGLLACKIIGVGFVIVMGLVDFVRRQRAPMDTAAREAGIFRTPSPSNITDATLSALWTYSGWETVSYVAGELKNPRRNIPLVTNLSMLLILSLFLLANFSYLTTLPFASIIASTSIGWTFSRHFFRRAGAALYVVVICLSTLGSLNSRTFAASRHTQAAAERQYLPPMIKTIGIEGGEDSDNDNDNDKVPHADDASKQSLFARYWHNPVHFRDGSIPLSANIFNALLTIIYILVGDLGSLIIFVGIVSFSTAFAAILGLLRLRLVPHRLPSSSLSSPVEQGETHDIDSDRSTDESGDKTGKFAVPLVLIFLALAAIGAVVTISALRHPTESIGLILFCTLSATLVFPRVQEIRRVQNGNDL